ncbi:choice-of-anchor tandem repeat GloVer-containing protein [Adhaeribacter radiodurans]|uniref:T9SS type A sorting domain-containing protein n=1 Tax=Adhaeribacter radiodurans TaxID=2745197 RepID=A0A7L7L2E9_9BACT|nr:choice-of-anchor tandem repeat GloVer-containing protein [Adhaeribacter radiodurans]QMU26933.1 T9SS type A sorting domain-containing protein [Adhaeribacter radiodurans]
MKKFVLLNALKFLSSEALHGLKPVILPLFLSRQYRASLLITILVLCPFLNVWAQDILAGLTSDGGLQGAGTAFTIKSDGTGFTVQKTFALSGKSPYGDLIKASDGNFYGMNSAGGTYGYGNIFKMTSAGKITNLYSFNYTTNGGNPQGSLKQGADGKFYGMTYSGGTNGYGTIFSFTPSGTYTVLHHFSLNADGGYPYDNLIQGTDGNFYGLTSQGGTYNNGTIFKISPSGTFNVLRHLNQASDGAYPYGSLVQGADGNFYGLTSQGGTYNNGTIFRVSPGGTFTVRRHLKYSSDGGYATGNSLIKAPDGNFYGMLYQGGLLGYGTIFKLTPGGSFTVLKSLDYTTQGGYPKGSLTQNTDGNLYGIMQSGGTYGYGTIFKITTSGTYTVLKHLNAAPNGGNAQGSLLRNSSDGNFYGMTSYGGSGNGGTIFKMTPVGAYTVLAHLPESSGANPSAGLIQARDGNFYGMTNNGGTNDNGSIFKFCSSTFSTVKSFNSSVNGQNPRGSLVQGSDGNLYGLASKGGSYGYGTIFKMTPGGTLSVLWNLNRTNDGGLPYGSLVQGADGNFYGMTSEGGIYDYGTVFRITPGGTFTVLWNFNLTNDGGFPYGSLIRGTDNNFYGMTYSGGINGYGTIFKITPGGVLTVIKKLDNVNGGKPYGNNLMQGQDGNFYGLTYYGGTYGYGTVFKCTPGGTLTVLHHLNILADGANPVGGLVRGSNGKLYGLTTYGGTYQGGTIFTISTTGTYSVVRHLNPTTDGNRPLGGLVVQKANPVANAQSVTTAVNTPKAITLTGSGGTPLEFKVAGQPQHGTLTGSNANRVYTPDPGFTGTDSFNFRVIWGCQSSTSQKVTITVGPLSTIRLNSGGDAVSTSLGNFRADAYFRGSTSISSTASPISNTTNDALYQDNRRVTNAGDSFSYNVPVTNGTYSVKLHFAEIYYSAAGKRKFNVTAEGTSWLSNYDIYVAAGGAKKAVIATKNVTVTDGTLNLNFISKVDKACVAAIEVVPVAGADRSIMDSQLIKPENELVTSLYPNPVKDRLTIELAAPAEHLFTAVIDATGKEVQQNKHELINKNKVELTVATLPAGLYLVQLQTGQARQTLKFMKE